MTSLFDFDLITPREVTHLGSAQAVASRLGGAFDEAKAATQGESRRELLEHSLVQNRLRQIPDCLWADHAKAPYKLGLELPTGRQVIVQAARHRARHARYQLPDADLVILDRDILIRAALFLYFSIRGKSDFKALLAQSFVFAYNAIVPNRPIPLQSYIVNGIIFNPAEKPLFLECLNSLLDFLALHEIGHICADQNGLTSPFFRVAIEPAPEQAKEQRYHVSFYRAISTENRLRFPNTMNKGQVEELFCDAFALTARVLMDASGTFTPMVFGALSTRLMLLSQFLSLEDMRNMHGDGPCGQVTIARLSYANRDVPSVDGKRPMIHPINRHESHPYSIQRLDSLVIHTKWIFRQFGINDHPLAPDGNSELQDRTMATWNSGLRQGQDMLIDCLRGPELEGMEYRIAAWDELTETLGAEDITPSVLKTLAYAALTPYLPPYPTTGDELEHLPADALFTKVVMQLCATLGAPQRWLESQRSNSS